VGPTGRGDLWYHRSSLYESELASAVEAALAA
jgi:hypothetical protein